MDEVLPVRSSPPHHYLIRIPAGRWLTANQRGSWHVRARMTRQWRHAAAMYAKYHKVPRLAGARVVVELCFTSNRRRDPANWAPTAKAVVDGLVDAGVFDDDDATRVVGPDLRLGPLAKRDTAVVHVWPRQP